MPTAYVAVYDTLADWEVGHLLAELRTGRFSGTPFHVVTVAETCEPVMTMGGVRILPDAILADLQPVASSLLAAQAAGADRAPTRTSPTGVGALARL